MLAVVNLQSVVFFVSVAVTFESKKIEKYAGGGYTHFMDNENVVTLTTNSMLQCSIMCTATAGCCTMGYKKSTKTCQMKFDCCPAVKIKRKAGTKTDFVLQKIPIKENTPRDKLKDCSDLSDGSPPGVYEIYPSSSKSLKVYCDNGWTVIQRHKDPTVSFVRPWNDYKTGFGNVSLDHWLGNDNIHLLTSNNKTCGRRLKLVLTDWTGEVRSAVYNIFHIGDESSKYKLYARGGKGSGLFTEDPPTDALGGLSSQSFSTVDQDNDNDSGHCAQSRQAGWWFAKCSFSCLNGRIQQGESSWKTMHWYYWHNDPWSLKASIMLIQ